MNSFPNWRAAEALKAKSVDIMLQISVSKGDTIPVFSLTLYHIETRKSTGFDMIIHFLCLHKNNC